MDETSPTTQPAADTTDTTAAPAPADPDAAPAVAAALDADTAPPAAADPTPDAADPPLPDDGNDQADAPDEAHPFIAAMRQELDKIANMPAHIWHEIERAFERVADKL